MRKRPVFSPLDSGKETQQTGGDVPKGSLETQDAEIHPEVQRDIFLYNSYCALRNFMEAVTSSVEESYSKEPENTPENLSSTQQLYCTQVVNKLEAGKAHLAQVYPLPYRVEVLENIFSLLFGTYEDLYEGRTQQNESDDLDTGEEETRSLSTSNRTGSWESIASSVDLSVEVHGPFSPLKDQDKMTSPTSLPSTPDSSLKHKEASKPSGLESTSRRQLFKHKRSESDSSLLKKIHDVIVEDKPAEPAASQDDATITRQSENDSFSGNVLSSKGSSKAAISDDNDLKCEFVINDEVVPDVLKTLKECLMELNAAKFAELRKGASSRKLEGFPLSVVKPKPK